MKALGFTLLLAGAFRLRGEEPMEMGPFPTREMFPLYLLPMVYQPVDPTLVGAGRWRVTLDHIRANTFEFSEVFKEEHPQAAGGRTVVHREEVEEQASRFAAIPILFFFDAESVRTALRVRVGLSEATDLWGELPFHSQSGGSLDGVIEGVHSLGFKQFGREYIARDQLTMLVITRGRLRFFTQEPMRAKTQDPQVGLVHRIVQGPILGLSVCLALKPPLTHMYGELRSGWDHSLSISARWKPSPRHVFYFGGGFVRRPGGSGAYNAMAFGSMRDAWGMHAAWEYRGWTALRPYLQFLEQSGNLPRQPYQKLDRPSLQHDLGVHWQFRRDAVLTLRYLNNLTHNENTADMGLGLALTAQF